MSGSVVCGRSNFACGRSINACGRSSSVCGHSGCLLQDILYNASERCGMTSGSVKCNKYSFGDNYTCGKCRRADGALYVFTLNATLNYFCTSIRKPNQRRIRALSSFQAAIRSNRNMKYNSWCELIVFLITPTWECVYRSCTEKKNDAVDMINVDWSAIFTTLPYLQDKTSQIKPRYDRGTRSRPSPLLSSRNALTTPQEQWCCYSQRRTYLNIFLSIGLRRR